MPDQRPFTPVSFNQFLHEKKLMASRCPACDALYLPPRAICPDCHDDALEWVELSGKGKLAAFSSINIGLSMMAAEGYDRENPYCSGIVELDEGVMISARILGVDAQHPESIRIGTPLIATFLERGSGDDQVTLLAFST